jgi:hypothetical protein
MTGFAPDQLVTVPRQDEAVATPSGDRRAEGIIDDADAPLRSPADGNRQDRIGGHDIPVCRTASFVWMKRQESTGGGQLEPTEATVGRKLNESADAQEGLMYVGHPTPSPTTGPFREGPDDEIAMKQSAATGAPQQRHACGVVVFAAASTPSVPLPSAPAIDSAHRALTASSSPASAGVMRPVTLTSRSR